SKCAMPCASSQSIRRFTSPITSGPMPSPGRSSSLCVAMVRYLRNIVCPSRPGNPRGVLKRRERIGKAARTGQQCTHRASAPQDGPPSLMPAAVLFPLPSASLLGAGVVTAQFGLRTVEPLSGASISVPSFTLLFLLASPLILAGAPLVWRGLPIFAAIGLVFPALLTLLTFASNRALGPVVTSTLGNLAPLFAVALAVILLHEPLHAPPLGCIAS